MNLYGVLVLLNTIYIDALRNSYYRVKLIKNQTSFNREGGIIYGENSSLAIDEDMKTCSYAGNKPGTFDDPWLRIQLDRVYNITRIKVVHDIDGQYIRTFFFMKFYFSNDTKNHESIMIDEESGNYYDVHFDRGYMAKLITISESSRIVICEMQVFADLKSVNLAYNRPFFINKMYQFKNPENSYDGDPSTCAKIATGLVEAATIRVELDSVYYISNVDIHHREIHRDIHVFVSNNDENYEEHFCASTHNITQYEVNLQVQFLKCIKPLKGRFVTIKKPRDAARFRFLICEVEIYSRRFPGEKSETLSPPCLKHEYKCLEGECIHKDFLCDGTNDCPLADDETSECEAGNDKFKCKRRKRYINLTSLCDGVVDCPDYSDEESCFDLEKRFLRVTFKGESNYYICSDYWEEKYSVDICNDYDRDFYRTRFKKNNEVQKYLTIRGAPISGKFPLTSMLEYSQKCNSNLFVNLNCYLRRDLANTCGTRGFPDILVEPYIFKGYDAKPGAFPWQVHILMTTENFTRSACGGSLIKSRWILTSAHCLRRITNPNQIKVILGTVINQDYYAKRLDVSHFIPHPQYKDFFNDIALLRIESSVTYTKYIRPICLPDKILDQKTLMSFQYCVATGFGRTNRSLLQPKDAPDMLQQTRMNIVDDDDCQDYLESKRMNRMSIRKRMLEMNYFCAGQMPLSESSNICKGDSGGAYACRSTNGIWTQVGLATFSYIPEYENETICLNSLFLKADRYLDFIHTVTKKFENVKKSKFERHFKNCLNSFSWFMIAIFFKHFNSTC